MKLNRFLTILVIVIVILTAAFAVAAPAFAAASCVYNSQHGWHIVGGGGDNDHWYETEDECLAALNTPTVEPTLTSEPTDTEDPTQEPTLEPTITAEPTELPEATSTPGSPWPDPIPTYMPPPTLVVPVPTLEPISRAAKNCEWVWYNKIDGKVYKDEGYRYFDNPEHAWCKVWLHNKLGIDYNVYKIQNPL